MEKALISSTQYLEWYALVLTGILQASYLFIHRDGPTGRIERGVLSIASAMSLMYLIILVWPLDPITFPALVVVLVIVTIQSASSTRMWQDRNRPNDPYPRIWYKSLSGRGVNFYLLTSLSGYLAVFAALEWGDRLHSFPSRAM